MTPAAYESFLNEIVRTLEADPAVLGLITLGTTADASARDAWSDHDFWIVTEPGAQTRYLDSRDWLPNSDEILLTVRHGKSHRGVLFQNKHKVEYAVFDHDEAMAGKIARFAVLIDRGGIGELAEQIREKTYDQCAAASATSDKFENLCVLLWTAHGLDARGERLKARWYINLAIDRLLDLMAANGALEEISDFLDPRRRLEQTNPVIASRLEQIILEPITEAAVGIIDLCESELRLHRPDLAWSTLMTVRDWLGKS